MTEIEVIQDGVKNIMTLEQFFTDYWGLFRNQVIKVIEDELLKNGKLKELLK